MGSEITVMCDGSYFIMPPRLRVFGFRGINPPKFGPPINIATSSKTIYSWCVMGGTTGQHLFGT